MSKLIKIERQVVFKVAGAEFPSAAAAKAFLVEKAALETTTAAVQRASAKTPLEGFTGTPEALAKFINLVNGVLKGKVKVKAPAAKAPAAAKPATAPKAPSEPKAAVKKVTAPKATKPKAASTGVKTRAKAGVSLPPPPEFPG